MIPVDLQRTFIAAVLKERKIRHNIAFRNWQNRHVQALGRDMSKSAGMFAADIWAARMLIDAKWGQGRATPSCIAKWLWKRGWRNGYSESSMRPMVYKAIKSIEALETTKNVDGGGLYWKPFAWPR